MHIEYFAVFAPLIAFILAGVLGGKLGDKLGDKFAQIITCAGMLVATIASIQLFNNMGTATLPYTLPIIEWITLEDFNVNWSLRIDQLSIIMICIVNIVSLCVHVYSVGYMAHDNGKSRFMAYLSLFTFAMLILVSADNLLQLFFGWEGVGLASYLLICFWYEKNSANAASIKAFILNRVGDLGLILGIMTAFIIFGTLQFDEIFKNVTAHTGDKFNFWGYEVNALNLMALLLFLGAVGKSAQLGLHTWLADAMEGPTPVSALIHAATMVTAGVFLLARFSPVYEYTPDILMIITIVGALTAFIAATIAMTQFDIKRVIAYSTMSQLGYMFFAIGVSAYGAAMFHLLTHAFFKALLFLGAGSVIHAMSGEQDMRKMGGLWRKIPLTYILMWIGSLSLAGFPFLAGYYSKDLILESSWAANTTIGHFAFYIGIAAAVMTAFYSWRLIIMTFHGAPRADEEVIKNLHESPLVMMVPLIILAIGAFGAGAYFYDGFAVSGILKNSVIALNANAHIVEDWVKLLPTIACLIGIFLGYLAYMFVPSIPAFVARIFKPFYILFFRKWFFDELYNLIFVRPAEFMGKSFLKHGDGNVIDGIFVDGFADLGSKISGILSRFQSGYIYQYAFVMMIGLIAIISWIAFSTNLFTNLFNIVME